MKYKVTRPDGIVVDGKAAGRDDVVELDDAHAAVLMRKGAVVKASPQVTKVTAPTVAKKKASKKKAKGGRR